MSEFRIMTDEEREQAGVGQYDYVWMNSCLCGKDNSDDDGWPQHLTITPRGSGASDPCPRCGRTYVLEVMVKER